MSKRRLQEEDVIELYDILSRQLSEDRASLDSILKELRDFVGNEPLRYVDIGETLAKIADLKTKQTGQVIEVFKIVEKAVPDQEIGGLTMEDLELINEKVKTDVSDKH
jgi:hypothetical protein